MTATASNPDDSIDPTYSGSSTEHSAKLPGDRASITRTADGAVKVAGRSIEKTQAEVALAGATLKKVTEVTGTAGENRIERERITQFSLEASVAVGARAEVKGKERLAGIELEAGSQVGARVRYRVSLPDTTASETGKSTPATAEQAARVNPFNPTTLPIGGRVLLDSQQFQQSELKVAFRHIATVNQLTEAEGVGVAISRLDEHHVRVVTGPNKAIESLQGVGVDLGIARVMAGRQDALGQSKLQTADFDLRDPDARAAYIRMLATGQVADQTPGVSNVAQLERLDYSSQQRLQVGLVNDLVSADIAGRRNTGTAIQSTAPDGKVTVTQQLSYDDNVKLTIVRAFIRDGETLREDVDARRYQFLVDTDVPTPGFMDKVVGGRNEAVEERNIATGLNLALTGSTEGPGQIRPGEKVSVSFSEAQMQEFMQRTQKMVERPLGHLDPLAGIARAGYGDQPQRDGLEFAIGIARSLQGNADQFGKHLQRVAQDGDPRGPVHPINAHLTRSDGTLLNAPVQSQQQAPAPLSPAGRTATLDPRHSDHEANAIYKQNFQAAERLACTQGGLPDQAVERLAMAGTIAAQRAGLSQVDHLVVGNRGQAFVVQGALDSPAHLRAGFDYQTALNTPIEDSFSRLEVASESRAQSDLRTQEHEHETRLMAARGL